MPFTPHCRRIRAIRLAMSRHQDRARLPTSGLGRGPRTRCRAEVLPDIGLACAEQLPLPPPCYSGGISRSSCFASSCRVMIRIPVSDQYSPRPWLSFSLSR